MLREWPGIFTDRDQRSTFWALNFENLYLGVLATAAVFFGLLDKCCIFKCFIFSTVFVWVQFYSPGTSLCFIKHSSSLLSYRV